MKNLGRITIFIFIFSLIFAPVSTIGAVSSLKGVNLEVSPKTTNSLADWTISFEIPESTKVGHILISLSGFAPDLSQASLSVTGLPTGTAKLGKTNPSCASNCDDIRYYFSDVIDVSATTKVSFKLTNVKNSDKIGRTGVNSISVFSSKYPQMDLAFSASDYFVQLVEGDGIDPQADPESQPYQDIREVLINELFYQPGAQTTKLNEIEDPSNVKDLTFDLKGKVKVMFKEPVDLSNEEAIHYIANLADYMTFDYYYFWVAPELISFFNVPLEITYYNLPYVWEPNIIKDDAYSIPADELDSYNSVIVDGQPQISFVITETGAYSVMPKLALYIQDNQKVVAPENKQTFTGRISDPEAKLSFRLNNKDIFLEPKIDQKTGEFSFVLELDKGSNLLEVEAESKFGKIEKINKVIQYSTGDEQIEDTRSDAFNPIYYIVMALVVLALFLVGAIIYLVKTKK